MNIRERMKKDADYIIELRRNFHRNPELSFQEFKTKARVCEELSRMGILFREVGKSGVIGEIIGRKNSSVDRKRTVALRADMDALPIQDMKNCPYASQVPGVSHACGHDAHTAMLLGAAKILNEQKENFSGSVRLIFQPAEEKGPGAISMVEGGAAKEVDAFFAIHVWNEIPLGAIAVPEGALTAFTGRFLIDVTGKSSHVAVPEMGIDALLIATGIVQNIQSLKNKFINPNESAIISVGQLNSGTSHNVVAESAQMTGVVRCYNESVRQIIFNKIQAISECTAKMLGGSVKCTFIKGSNAIINNGALCELAKTAFLDAADDGKVVSIERSAIGEDFSEYLKYAPGVMVLLGTMAEDEVILAKHRGDFDINEKALVYGAALHVCFALRFLAAK